MQMVVIVGLTGGIASGKSTVTQMLRELGAEVIDADVIAREIVMPGEDALDEIVAAFGTEVLAADGTLDRAKLGERVFKDADARVMLNTITHPRIGQRMWQRAQEASEAGHKWVVYDAALLVENNIHKLLDSLIVVAAAREAQIARMKARDGLTQREAEERLAAQLPLEQKVAVADYVIWNDGTIAQTRVQVAELFEAIERAVQARGSAKVARPEEQT